MKTGHLAHAGTTVVRQVADAVRARIVREQLQRGAALPSYRELANELDVAYWTVKRGIDELVAEGVVLQQRGRGIFVNKELSLSPRPLDRLGVICPSSRTSLFAHFYLTEIMHGAMLGAPPQTRLHIFSFHEDGLVDAAQLGAENIDGVLLINIENDDYLRTFARWGTPGVVVDYCPTTPVMDHVACDNAAAARQVVAHLAALGHRHVAFAAIPARSPVVSRDTADVLLIRESSDVRERQEESLRALQEQGIRVLQLAKPRLAAGGYLNEAAVADRLAGLADRPTALLTADASFAARLALALQHKGVRVPEDISVCAVAGDRDASFRKPLVTHCCFDFLGMGRLAVELLAARCRQPGEAKTRGHRIGFEFVAGETTAPASRQAKASSGKTLPTPAGEGVQKETWGRKKAFSQRR
jgi:DNA-binding LacI/PurR family transcriptional regulator